MDLTESWRTELPFSIIERYDIIETRNAAAMFKASNPELLAEMVTVLDGFYFDVERIVRGGGSKHFISAELDEAFRVANWREAKFKQKLITELVLNPYKPAGEKSKTTRSSASEYEGHQIDNVKGRVGLDVEWNPKDGNLDRDFSNFRSLYDAGVLDLGILIVRRERDMRSLWSDTIARAKELNNANFVSAKWSERLEKTPVDPLGTSTTSNFEKLETRVKRGDGGGCPILAIAITTRCYKPPVDLDVEIQRIASNHTTGRPVERLAERLFPNATIGDLEEAISEPDDD
ncbi:BglII/BstYI family type II restriction endonuclease [Agromyces sp. CCNWLW203]|uniref:BglII/BstYI family type II restriction endonuclease n=1 Tax=Agromyces sp. CCNWLW203 TaxID=3112842 RepID=UPI002F9638D7